jgi:steroid delta-isomerase
MQTTYDAMIRFAEDWIAAWNRRDLDAVLAHYADDAQFVSPVARAVVGRPALHNKQELAAYWRGALARITTLQVRLDHAAWDERRRELVVVYEASLNGERKRACEIMRFDAAGRQVSGEALYGAVI